MILSADTLPSIPYEGRRCGSESLLNEDGSCAHLPNEFRLDLFYLYCWLPPISIAADYTVGHVEYADAVQRAEFFIHM